MSYGEESVYSPEPGYFYATSNVPMPDSVSENIKKQN